MRIKRPKKCQYHRSTSFAIEMILHEMPHPPGSNFYLVATTFSKFCQNRVPKAEPIFTGFCEILGFFPYEQNETREWPKCEQDVQKSAWSGSDVASEMSMRHSDAEGTSIHFVGFVRIICFRFCHRMLAESLNP